MWVGVDADDGDLTVLTNLGEKMSDDEVDELLKAVDTSSGEINYTGMDLHFGGVFVCGFVLGTNTNFQISSEPFSPTKSLPPLRNIHIIHPPTHTISDGWRFICLGAWNRGVRWSTGVDI